MSKKYSKKERNQFFEEVVSKCYVTPGQEFRLGDHETRWKVDDRLEHVSEAKIIKAAGRQSKKNLKALSEAQELLYASNKYSMLLVFQAMDAAGKDSTIKHVMSGVNPQGCEVNSFKKPSSEESNHHWLWRYNGKMPSKGSIGIFNRSYYEEVLVVKVHPDLQDADRLSYWQGDDIWKMRYEDINNMEKHLSRNGIIILKFFLNVSKEEQRNRFVERLENSKKHWKFSNSDLAERALWDSYMEAFESAINATSTEHAPWYVIPADDKWRMRAIVSQIITETIGSLDLEYPKISAEKKIQLEKAREELGLK